MKASEIIYTLRTLYEKVPTDDADLSDAQWMHLIDIWRAKLLRQDLSDGKQVGAVAEQTLCLVTSRWEKSEKNFMATCRAYKTVRFPQLLVSKQGETICRVAEHPLEPSYKLTTLQNLRYLLQSRLTSRAPKAILEDQRLYVYSTDVIEEVYLSGIFESPQLVNQFVGTEDPFAPYEFEYPLSATHLDALYRGIMDTSFRTLKATTLDLTNDGHSPTQQ